MGTEPNRLDARHRSARMLRTALGDAIAEWLADPQIIEIMLNPAGRLWVDWLGEGIADSGRTMTPADGERIVRPAAHHIGAAVPAAGPRVPAYRTSGGASLAALPSTIRPRSPLVDPTNQNSAT